MWVSEKGRLTTDCPFCPQDERRRITTPTGRAKVSIQLALLPNRRKAVTFEFVALPVLIRFECGVSFHFLQVMEFGIDKRAQTLQGLAFPLQEEAKEALKQLKQKRINYIQLVSCHSLVHYTSENP